MRTKIRKIGSWNTWKSIRTKHNLEILTINIAVIVGVFVAAAVIQFN